MHQSCNTNQDLPDIFEFISFFLFRLADSLGIYSDLANVKMKK